MPQRCSLSTLVRVMGSRGWFASCNRQAGADRSRRRPLLCQRQLAISFCRDRIAALAKGGVPAAIAHDAADLLAFDIAVDAGHPRVDFGEQQPLARLDDMVGPRNGARCGGLDAGQVPARTRSGSARSPNRRCIRPRAESCRARHGGPSPSAGWGSHRPGCRERSVARSSTCPSATPRRSRGCQCGRRRR